MRYEKELSALSALLFSECVGFLLGSNTVYRATYASTVGVILCIYRTWQDQNERTIRHMPDKYNAQ
ncbi:hypothetical protein F5Y04DRAFT_265416 [Hypomontagnella monticulosa]|nr:hypothetical protein F5Y04DRAFT_265416 [Hypomontagnella monticulosa]